MLASISTAAILHYIIYILNLAISDSILACGYICDDLSKKPPNLH